MNEFKEIYNANNNTTGSYNTADGDSSPLANSIGSLGKGTSNPDRPAMPDDFIECYKYSSNT
jgi:hypothetical protein